jgi:hypothetical protein
MATELIFDTLKLANRLEREAGADPLFAAVLASGLADELGERLATRTDLEREINGVRADLGGEIQSLRSDLEAKIEAVRSDLEARIEAVRPELRTEIQDVRAEIRVLGWMMKTTLAGVAALLAMIVPVVLKTLRLG